MAENDNSGIKLRCTARFTASRGGSTIILSIIGSDKLHDTS
jgi:hypothetical protein